MQPKEPQTSKPKWSSQPKNPISKPIGGTKGVTNLTGSSGMRARHHLQKEIKVKQIEMIETRLKDRWYEDAKWRRKKTSNDARKNK